MSYDACPNCGQDFNAARLAIVEAADALEAEDRGWSDDDQVYEVVQWLRTRAAGLGYETADMP